MPVTGANVTLLEEFQDSLEVLEALELPEPPWNMAEKMKPPPPPHSSVCSPFVVTYVTDSDTNVGLDY